MTTYGVEKSSSDSSTGEDTLGDSTRSSRSRQSETSRSGSSGVTSTGDTDHPFTGRDQTTVRRSVSNDVVEYGSSRGSFSSRGSGRVSDTGGRAGRGGDWVRGGEATICDSTGDSVSVPDCAATRQSPHINMATGERTYPQ